MRWYNNELQILGYTYTNKIPDYKLLGAASLNTFHSCKIELTKDKYVFSFDNKSVTLPRSLGNANGYQFYPYFGDDAAAPHDVVIWIKGGNKKIVRFGYIDFALRIFPSAFISLKMADTIRSGMSVEYIA
jgi:hypothetical protein